MRSAFYGCRKAWPARAPEPGLPAERPTLERGERAAELLNALLRLYCQSAMTKRFAPGSPSPKPLPEVQPFIMAR
jgi:hypothetical protein